MNRLISACIATSLSFVAFAHADELTLFQLTESSPFGPPSSLLYTNADGVFSLETRFLACDGNVCINFQGNTPGIFANMWFAAPFNQQLSPGTYSGVARFPFQNFDQPGLDIAANGTGPNTVTGNFEVLQALYDSAGQIQNFGATFEEDFGPSFPEVWTGTVYYNFDPSLTDVPEPTSLSLVLVGFAGIMAYSKFRMMYSRTSGTRFDHDPLC